MDGLDELDLRNNNIASFESKTLDRVPRIKKLNLSHNQIDDDGLLHHMLSMRELTDLDLGFNRIGEGAVRDISQMRNLKKLDLAGNRIGDVGVRRISQILRASESDPFLVRR